MRARGNILVLGLPTVIAICFLYNFALTYLTAERAHIGIYEQRREWLVAHILAGSVALLLGPVQMWLGLNRRTANLHRALGITYVLSVALGAAAAFYLAFHTDFGWVFGIGFASMGFAWILTTAFATLAIYRRRVEQHREWMIRSYIVTFAFVTFRILESTMEIAGAGTIVERMTAASWLAWTIPLLITESILQGRRIFGRSATVVRVQSASLVEPRAPLPIKTSSIADDLIARYSIGKK